jgi:hypothetical protein
MRVAKFKVPVSVSKEFIDYTNKKGLQCNIVATKETEYEIEIPFTKEQYPIIDELEELEDLLDTLTIIGITTLSLLAAELEKQLLEKMELNKSKEKRSSAEKTTSEKHCFFKDFVAKMDKESTSKTSTKK